MKDFKRKYFNLHFFAKAFLGVISIALFVQVLKGVYKLASKNYPLKESDIYKIDSFRLQGKAFYNGGSKSGGPYYDFTSTNGYSFAIDQKMYPGIIDKNEFADTFSYHNLKFIAYSDKKAAELYKKSKEPIHINLLQVQVGDKMYISTEGVNAGYRNKVARNVLMFIFLFGFILFTYLRTGKIFK